MDKEKLFEKLKIVNNVASKASVLLIYSKMFSKLNRPNYDIYPGIYNIKRTNLKREVFKIKSDDCFLTAYLYKAKKPKGLVIFSHGLKSGADDYIPIFEYLVSKSYSVLAFDNKGVYESDGTSMVGMCEGLVDLDHVLDYVEESVDLCKMKLYLLGHSMGAYSCASALAIHKNIKACVCLAGFNDGYKLFLEKASEFAPDDFVNIPRDLLNEYQEYLFGKYINYNAVKGINSVDIPVLIYHGLNDKTIKYNLQSITSHKNEITNKNAIFIDFDGINGNHKYIWHSINSSIYQKKIDDEIKMIKKQFKRDLTIDELVSYYKNVDNKLYSEINYEMFDYIIDVFNNVK